VSSKLNFSDYLGALKVRFAINRTTYTVTPGLYAIGKPDKSSHVLVTANYKLSFDSLRQHLTTIDCWILVLDTKGINVWCAAGKGTFGTEELVKKITSCNLNQIIDHKKIIVPQLGAVGVSAHELKNKTGFNIVYGPVRASDLPAFLDNNMKATSDMRLVKFTFYDRMVLTPVEFIINFKYFLLASIAILLISGITLSSRSLSFSLNPGLYTVLGLFAAYICGSILGPILLPYLPGRAFSLKGFWLGAGAAVFVSILLYTKLSLIEMVSLACLMIPTTSYLTTNFTGSSTYTSLSGVLKEMRIALPLQIGSSLVGLLLLIISRFI
jgi:hypothetical protein